MLLAISMDASDLASDADDLRLVCHVCQLRHVCQAFLADMGQNGQEWRRWRAAVPGPTRRLTAAGADGS